MVQFGKTESTTNYTTTNNDVADRRTINSVYDTNASRTKVNITDDKTHKEYFT